MTEAPLLPFVTPALKRPPPTRSGSSVAGSSEPNESVEVVTPDQYCADLLLECAAPTMLAGIVPGAGWIVRLEASPAGKGSWWMLEVLSILDRWLESVPIPCARVLYGGHSYLIRSSTETAPHGPAARATLAAAHTVAH